MGNQPSSLHSAGHGPVHTGNSHPNVVEDEQPPLYQDVDKTLLSYADDEPPNYDADGWDILSHPQAADESVKDEEVAGERVEDVPTVERLKVKVAAKKVTSVTGDGKKGCTHYSDRGCQLTSTKRTCCECSDARAHTESGRYEAFVDGVGYVENAERWEYYCPGCRASFEAADCETSRARWHRERMEELERQRREALAAERARWESAEEVARRARQREKQHRKKRRDLFVRTRCLHWFQRDCSVTATGGKCCECADDRPVSKTGLYATYKDGVGIVHDAQRWDMYCPNCKHVLDVIHARPKKR